MTDRVGVFLDYQNVHLGAWHRFLPSEERAEAALVHPVRLAELLVSRRRRDSELAMVGVYRGRPLPQHQRTMRAANDAQAEAWQRDSRVRMVQRDLQYRGWPSQPPVEKGIDVALAVDLVRSAMLGVHDAVVVFSADTDLLPAIEVTFHDTTTHLEVAAWDDLWPLWLPQLVQQGRHLPYCHFLGRRDFEGVRDRRKYV